MKNLFLYFGISITIVTTVYYIYYFSGHVSDIPRLAFSSKAALVCCVAVLLYMVIILLGGTVWYFFLEQYKQNISWLDSQIIYGQSQFGKYLPGNFAHHVGRVVLSRKHGIAMPVIVVSMMLEMVWAIAIGLGMAAVISIVGAGHAIESGYGHSAYYIAAALFAVVVILSYLFLRYLKRNVHPVSGRLQYLCRLGLPGAMSLMKVTALYVISFLIFGLIMGLHAKYLFNVHDVNLMLLVGIFAWAWTLGFITPGSPAGLGVRDTVLLAALTPLYGSGVAIGLSLSLRLVTTLGDGVWFFVSLLTPSLVRKKSIKINQE